MRTTFVFLALAAALPSAERLLAEPVTYYYSKTETGFNKGCVDASQWKDAKGNPAGAVNDPLTAEDFYVLKGTIRTIADDAATPTIFPCKRLTLGVVGGAAGKINLYTRNSSAYVDFGSGDAQDGGYFANGSLDGRSNFSKDYNAHFRGKMTVVSPETAPFLIRPQSSRYKSFTFVSGLSSLAAEKGAALKFGGLSIDNKATTEALAVYLYADLSRFFGKVIVAPCCASHTANPTYTTTLYLKDGVFPGTVELQGGGRLRPENAQSTVKLANAVMADGSVLVLPVTSATGVDGRSLWQAGQIVVTNTLSLAGRVAINLSQVPDNGETNRFAVLTAKKDSFALSNFTVAVPSAMAAHSWYFRDHATLSIEEDEAAGTQTLYVTLEPLVRQTVSDTNNKTSQQPSALTQAASWSDGVLPHANAHYIVPAGMTLTLPEGTVFPGASLTVENTGWILAWNYVKDGVLKIPTLHLLSGATLYGGQGRQIDFAETHLIAESGVVTLAAFGGEDFNARLRFLPSTKISGSAELRLRIELSSVPRGNYHFQGDMTDFTGTISLKQTAGTPSYTAQYEALHLSRAEDLGAPLDTFTPAALFLSKWGRLVATADITVPAANKRGLTVSGVGVVDSAAFTLRLGMPLTVDGTLIKAGAGTLQLDADLAGVGESGGTIAVTNGTLAVASAGAIDGLTTAFSATGRLVLRQNSADEALMRYGIRNTGLDEPFTVVPALATLPLALDLSGVVLPSKGATIGVLTVSDDATNTVDRLYVPPRAPLSGYAASPVRLHDAERGWTTYAVQYVRAGLTLIVK